MVFEREKSAIFVAEMKRSVLIFAYWTTALLLFSVILCSSGYTFPDALFLASSLLPIAVLFRYLLAHLRFTSKRQGLRNLCFLTLFILTLAFLVIHLAHTFILALSNQAITEMHVVPLLLNPVFLLAMFLLIIAGDYFCGQIIEQHLPEIEEKITFISDRQPITLQRQEIIYVESCDTETWIYTSDGRHYRNKRSISAWANLLGHDFIRIHRSYLVRISACSGREGGEIVIGDVRLPISRKYKSVVQEMWGMPA